MAEFEDKLNAILGNQEAMGQIMALARSLSGEQEAPPSAPEGGDTYAPEPPPPAPDLSALLGQIDPQALQAGMEALGRLRSTESQSSALLSALRPFLRQESQARLDRAIRLARTVKLARVALEAVKGKEGEGV